MTFSDLGAIYITGEVSTRMDSDTGFARFVAASFKRYTHCDWGELCASDKALNDSAVQHNNDRIVASYQSKTHDWHIYIITERDRSITTILFPHEY